MDDDHGLDDHLRDAERVGERGPGLSLVEKLKHSINPKRCWDISVKKCNGSVENLRSLLIRTMTRHGMTCSK